MILAHAYYIAANLAPADLIHNPQQFQIQKFSGRAALVCPLPSPLLGATHAEETSARLHPLPNLGEGARNRAFLSGSPSPRIGRSGSRNSFRSGCANVGEPDGLRMRVLEVSSRLSAPSSETATHRPGGNLQVDASRQDRGWGMRAKGLERPQLVLNLELLHNPRALLDFDRPEDLGSWLNAVS